jgi:hypothetical protein
MASAPYFATIDLDVEKWKETQMLTTHPALLQELVRQHRQELLDEARWSGSTRTRRGRRRRGDE